MYKKYMRGSEVPTIVCRGQKQRRTTLENLGLPIQTNDPLTVQETRQGTKPHLLMDPLTAPRDPLACGDITGGIVAKNT